MQALKHVFTALKGFLMGAANVVPGVSGGTMALITGIYTDIVDALNAVMTPSVWKLLFKGRIREFWSAVRGGFLLALGIGMVASVFTLAKLIEYTLVQAPIQTWSFFFGLIVASAVYMLAEIKGWRWQDVLFTAVGIALGVSVCTLSPAQTPDALWFIFICGAVAICTMILPGISGSFILLVMGKYDYMMAAVSALDWGTLAVFAVGCVVGLLAFAKALHWLLGRWERQTMLVLLGFVLGSLVKVWPWANVPATGAPAGAALAISEGAALAAPAGVWTAVLWMAVGAVTVVIIELIANHKQ